MRKMLAVLFTLASWSLAAHAAAPPPVPALPDTERRTTYTISASLCLCNVGFQLYGDSTDYANWIEVWIDGVQQVGNWTLTSPTGNIATIPRPISDAVLRFTAKQTGTVQIVGARRPRRTSQLNENRGVAARDFNQIISDIEAQNRELWDRQARTPQVRPGETLALLPPLSSRANQGACFDAGGNLTSCVGVQGGSSLIAGNGIALTGVGPTTVTNNIAAGTGIRFTGTNPISISASAPYVTPNDYNFACDGATDYSTQLQNMITGSPGKVIYIPAGPACITGATLQLVDNTTIKGGGEGSIIKGIGAAVPVFSVQNKSNVTLSDFWCQGDDQVTSWTASSVGCLSIVQTSTTLTADNVKLRRMKLSGFNANYWVKGQVNGAALSVSNIEISDSYFLSVLTDVPADGVPQNNGNVAVAIFSGSAGNGQIINTVIRNNRIEGKYLCGGFALYGNHARPVIEGNLINSVGGGGVGHCVNGAGTDHNVHSVLVYDLYSDNHPPLEGRVQNNTIFNPWSTGIYFAGDGDATHDNSWRFLVADNLISGQQSGEDNTLPRASVAINDATDIAVIGNALYNGFGGVTAVGQFSGIIAIANNVCETGSTSSSTVSCIKVAAGIGTTNTAKFTVKGNTARLFGSGATAGSAIVASSSSGSRFHTLEISDNSINSEWSGLSVSGQYVTNSFTVKGNKFGGSAVNWMMNAGSNTGAPVAIVNNIFDSSDGVAGYGLFAQNGVIHMSGSKFINRTSGSNAMFRADGTCGTITGTQFNNVVQPAQVYAGSLGTTNPSTCTLNYLDHVQNLTPSELGSGGFGTANQKYKIDHWWHASTTASTAHLEGRILTGN